MQNSSHSPYRFHALLARLTEEAGRHSAKHAEFTLHSHFQPIFSLAHRRVVGHEGLLRATAESGKAVSPYTVFASARSESEIVLLDRLARLLHVSNFINHPVEHQWLFLNAEPNAFIHAGKYGPFFAELFDHYQLPPHQIVIEVLETAIDDNRLLGHAVEYFRELGCLIAIDDFGAGHSNIDRIWRLKPDIVKLDRTLITEASDNREARHILPGLVGLLHEAGALVLAEGVETEAEAMLAMESDCDLVQGYLFALPSPSFVEAQDSDETFNSLWNHFDERVKHEIEHNQTILIPYTQAFNDVAQQISEGREFLDATQSFLELGLALRCFLLDAEGRQIGRHTTQFAQASRSERYLPLLDTEGAVWSRRQYFRQAMKRFGEIQVSRPYLSLVNADYCVTLSLGMQINQAPCVLCADLLWLSENEDTDL